MASPSLSNPAAIPTGLFTFRPKIYNELPLIRHLKATYSRLELFPIDTQILRSSPPWQSQRPNRDFVPRLGIDQSDNRHDYMFMYE